MKLLCGIDGGTDILNNFKGSQNVLQLHVIDEEDDGRGCDEVEIGFM